MLQRANVKFSFTDVLYVAYLWSPSLSSLFLIEYILLNLTFSEHLRW